MATTPRIHLPAGAEIKPKLGSDDWTMRGFIALIAVYLLIALAFPLYAMLSKAFSTYQFDLSQYEFQVSDENGKFNTESISAQILNEQTNVYTDIDLSTGSGGRLAVTEFFPDFSFRSPVNYKIRGADKTAVFLVGSERHTGPEWLELDSNTFRRVVLRPNAATGLGNFTRYFETPALVRSIKNSLLISAISTLITVTLAFGFAYALNRSCMRFKGLFRLIAMAPILVPSLLPGIALVYLFGNQGMLKGLMMGESIYGPIGIVAGSVFFTFPHAMLAIRGISILRGKSLEDVLDSNHTWCSIRTNFCSICRF